MISVCCGIRMIPGKHANHYFNRKIQAKTPAKLTPKIRLLQANISF